MLQCPFCQAQHVANTVFCDECGSYLLEREEVGTDAAREEMGCTGKTEVLPVKAKDSAGTGPLAIRLRIGNQPQELEVPLLKPIRLGRNDPTQDIFPEIDLTDSLGRQYGVSRMHACILQRGSVVLVEDLGSINGTLLNNKRLVRHIPVALKDGDQLRLGKLPIQVSFVS